MQFIDLKKQYQLIETDVLNSIKKVLDHGQYIMGPEIGLLERQLADFVGTRHAIVNASGTDALLMALLALEIGPGDEVITSPFSFFATAEVIALCQAKPVFVDIDPATYNLDVKKLEAAITPNTKAIMPVSLYGQTADMAAINLIAKNMVYRLLKTPHKVLAPLKTGIIPVRYPPSDAQVSSHPSPWAGMVIPGPVLPMMIFSPSA